MIVICNKTRKLYFLFGTVIFIAAVTVSVICFLALDSFQKGAGCIIDLTTDFTCKHPLVLNSKRNKFIFPNVKNGIKFAANEKILLACPGDSNYLRVNREKQIEATCISHNIFLIEDSVTGTKQFRELECLKFPESTAVRSSEKCAGNFTRIQIGFKVDEFFIPTITTCFDETKWDSLYSSFELSPKIRYRQSYNRTNDFKEEDFYLGLEPGPSNLYEKKNQKKVFNRILGSNKFFKSNYLSRGHLTANADFIYVPQQLSTFFYVNVAPQWAKFNSGNWKKLEENCRDFAADRNSNLVVYTGIYGSAKLKDTKGTFQNLSLYNDDGKRRLTVPKVFWKVLHDPLDKTGIAFIGHNNPHENVTETLCPDICDKITWLSWDPKNITEGYSYCCDYRELKKVVGFMPELKIYDILT